MDATATADEFDTGKRDGPTLANVTRAVGPSSKIDPRVKLLNSWVDKKTHHIKSEFRKDAKQYMIDHNLDPKNPDNVYAVFGEFGHRAEPIISSKKSIVKHRAMWKSQGKYQDESEAA